MKQKNVFIGIGVICLAIAFGMSFWLNRPTARGENISFASEYDGREVMLKGSYWQVPDAEYAVLICPGYSCDRQKWRPMADLCVSNGFSVMSFDYSGQGASLGTIGFDNAKTDRIPIQIAEAIEELHRISDIDYSHIILLGHSMGGRSILRLLYDYNNAQAQTMISRRTIENVILISPEINYNFNAQASLFAGTSDATQEPWKSYSAEDTLGTNVYLFGSTADDIVSDEDILDIYRHLGGKTVPKSGVWEATQTNATGSRITVKITNGVLHSYQMYSPKFAAFVNEALENISGRKSTYEKNHFDLIYGSYIFGLLGLFLFIFGLNYRQTWKCDEKVPILIDDGKYLKWKLLMWLPGTVLAFLICCFSICMPFGSPVMNIPYMCFIAGYGLTMLLLYRRGCFPGTEGRLPTPNIKIRTNGKELIQCICLVLGTCFLVWYILRSSMYRLVPINARLFWVAFATVLMAIGYYVAGVENDMLVQKKESGKTRVLYNLIQYIPLFLLVLFYLIIKSYSGMIGQAQNMLFMYIFCIPLGNFLKNRLGNRLAGACVTAFLFQTFMITSAALIAFL